MILLSSSLFKFYKEIFKEKVEEYDIEGNNWHISTSTRPDKHVLQNKQLYFIIIVFVMFPCSWIMYWSRSWFTFKIICDTLTNEWGI